MLSQRGGLARSSASARPAPLRAAAAARRSGANAAATSSASSSSSPETISVARRSVDPAAATCSSSGRIRLAATTSARGRRLAAQVPALDRSSATPLARAFSRVPPPPPARSPPRSPARSRAWPPRSPARPSRSPGRRTSRRGSSSSSSSSDSRVVGWAPVPNAWPGSMHQVDDAGLAGRRRPRRAHPQPPAHQHRRVEPLPALGPVVGHLACRSPSRARRPPRPRPRPARAARPARRRRRTPPRHRQSTCSTPAGASSSSAASTSSPAAAGARTASRISAAPGARARTATRPRPGAGCPRSGCRAAPRSSSRWRRSRLRGITTLSTTCWSPRAPAADRRHAPAAQGHDRCPAGCRAPPRAPRRRRASAR